MASKLVCDRCKEECAEIQQVELASLETNKLGLRTQLHRYFELCVSCFEQWEERRAYRKQRFYKEYGFKKGKRCARCDKRSYVLSGNPASLNIFMDGDGLCNDCFTSWIAYWGAQLETFMCLYVEDKWKHLFIKKKVPKKPKSCYLCNKEDEHAAEWHFKHIKKWFYLCNLCYQMVSKVYLNYFNSEYNEEKDIALQEKEAYERIMSCKPILKGKSEENN